MDIGYARTSTDEQKAGLEGQIRELKALGVQELYQEQVSSVAERPQLTAAIRALRAGDRLVVTKLDRLARSVKHLGEILEEIEARKAGLVILSMNLDTSTATGKLMLNVMSSVAQFEREMMLERQREGIAKAKAEGKYKGRTPTARNKAEAVKALLAQGMEKTDIAKHLGISRASLYRILASQTA
jgi:DNA invertase Pin-like site-specific DNA recombinase